MEYCSGGRVVDLLNQFAPTGHPLPLPLLMKIFSSVLNALVYLHTQSPPIAHRDIKTANVLIQFLPGHNHVGENGEGAVFKLCDFGSCTTKVLPAELSQKQRQDAEDDIQKYTTLDYRAPEQVNLFSKCPVDTKVDIWGLGCFLYQTLFFKDAFGDKMNIMSGQYPLPPTPAIPDSILALLGQPALPDIFPNINFPFESKHSLFCFLPHLNRHPVNSGCQGASNCSGGGQLPPKNRLGEARNARFRNPHSQ